MISTTPLMIVLASLLSLFALQQLLKRIHTAPPPVDAKPVPNAPPLARGRLLQEGLSVVGLDQRAMSQLQTLIAEADVSALTTFLAFNRPAFIELNHALSQTQNSAEDTTAKITLPAGMQLETLSQYARRQLLSYDLKSTRLITRGLMARFGGHEFQHHFVQYAAREKKVTLHIPPFDPNRKIMETLAQSGIACKGRLIPLSQRLTVLKMGQLRQIAKDLKLDKKFTRKKDAAQFLADTPGSAVLLSMQYVIDDLFVLNPIKEDCDHIKEEWAFLSAYAELLITLPRIK
jgi:hypothetical protein